MEIEGRALPAASAATVDEDGTRQLELAAGMLGLPGFRVLACAEFEGELQVQVETTEDLTGCPSCARPRWVGRRTARDEPRSTRRRRAKPPVERSGPGVRRGERGPH